MLRRKYMDLLAYDALAWALNGPRGYIHAPRVDQKNVIISVTFLL
jgi:hypothetical protein